jgi:hypothetical protein
MMEGLVAEQVAKEFADWKENNKKNNCKECGITVLHSEICTKCLDEISIEF